MQCTHRNLLSLREGKPSDKCQKSSNLNGSVFQQVRSSWVARKGRRMSYPSTASGWIILLSQSIPSLILNTSVSWKPLAIANPEDGRSHGFTHPNQPVVAVSWFDVVAYCTWLSQITGSPYRLPTEAEWEKASRGGIEGQRFPWGSDLPDWMDPYCRDHTVEQPNVVGQDPANGYGAHNMGDLVHEWCKDWYASDYYRNSPDRNPQGPTNGVRRASRGGSWRHSIKVTRCAARSSIPPNRTFTDYGFRVAMSR